MRASSATQGSFMLMMSEASSYASSATQRAS